MIETINTQRFIAAYQAGVEEGRYRDGGAAQTIFMLLGALNSLHRRYRPGGKLSEAGIAHFAVARLAPGCEIR